MGHTFRVLFLLAELDPTRADQPVFRVDRCNDLPGDHAEDSRRRLVLAATRPARRMRDRDFFNVGASA